MKLFEISIPKLFISITAKNTFLVGGKGEYSLIEYNSNLEILGRYLNNKFSIQSANYVGTDFLICDIDRHQVLLCSPEGDVKWFCGKENSPREFQDVLSPPKYACYCDEKIYIADGKNNRVMCVDWKKNLSLFLTKMIVKRGVVAYVHSPEECPGGSQGA